MAQVKLKGNTVNTVGNLPPVGISAHDFSLVGKDLSEVKLSDYKGKKIILNIFPSLETGTCSASIRKFNEEAAKLNETVVICISRDLPFAHARFCETEGIENVVNASEYKDFKFSTDYGVKITDGLFESLMSRSIVVIDENGKVVYTKFSPEISEEPDYEAALAALK